MINHGTIRIALDKSNTGQWLGWFKKSSATSLYMPRVSFVVAGNILFHGESRHAEP